MASKYAFTPTLRELRFLFCQTSEHSAAVRSFLHRAYPPLKKHNPHIPIMMREASGQTPRVYARYTYGREKMVELAGKDEKGVEEALGGLVREGMS